MKPDIAEKAPQVESKTTIHFIMCIGLIHTIRPINENSKKSKSANSGITPIK